MATYWEKLRDPRWQKNRLEVMQRDGFRCTECGDFESTLNVHHAYYEKGREPWEYPSDALCTLCEPCHEQRQQAQLVVSRIATCFKTCDWYVLAGMAMQRAPQHIPSNHHFDVSGVGERELNEMAWGLARATESDPETVLALLKEVEGRLSVGDIANLCHRKAYMEEAHVAN